MRIKKASTVVVTVLVISFLTQAARAVTFDSASSNGSFNSVIDLAPPLTWTHTVGSGLSRALFVGVSTHTTVSNVADRVSSVTYGAQTMTRISPSLPAPGISSDGLNVVEMFVLVNPPIGADTVTVTFNTQVGVLQDYSVGGSASFFSVDQTTPNRTFVSATGTGTGPNVNVPDSLVGDIVLDTLAVSPNAGLVAVGPGQTMRWNGFFGGSFDVGAGSTEPAPGINTAMSWTTTFSDNWVLGAVAVTRITSAAGVSVGGRVLTADGRGIRGAMVAITDTNGTVFNSLSNGFGYYRFDDIPAGSGYVVSVRSKGYSFTPRSIDLQDDLGDLDFVADRPTFREK